MFAALDHPNNQTSKHYDIVVGILSLEKNFERRQAIRDTWMKYIQQLTGTARYVTMLLLYFFVTWYLHDTSARSRGQ